MIINLVLAAFCAWGAYANWVRYDAGDAKAGWWFLILVLLVVLNLGDLFW